MNKESLFYALKLKEMYSFGAVENNNDDSNEEDLDELVGELTTERNEFDKEEVRRFIADP